ncbi:MAG TPA: hypothetical protein VK589_21105, partial [Chryseolinea sp.]|nr:hypothetical protein [Chryseolinea sp.]
LMVIATFRASSNCAGLLVKNTNKGGVVRAAVGEGDQYHVELVSTSGRNASTIISTFSGFALFPSIVMCSHALVGVLHQQAHTRESTTTLTLMPTHLMVIATFRASSNCAGLLVKNTNKGGG